MSFESSMIMEFFVSDTLQFLDLWRHALVASVRSDAPDLSARQMAMMLIVYRGDGPHTVRGLARTLNISKPAVSRALDRLGDLGYVCRERDANDGRNILVQRTVGGADFLARFAAMINEAKAQMPVGLMPSLVLPLVAADEPMVEDSHWIAEAA